MNGEGGGQTWWLPAMGTRREEQIGYEILLTILQCWGRLLVYAVVASWYEALAFMR